VNKVDEHSFGIAERRSEINKTDLQINKMEPSPRDVHDKRQVGRDLQEANDNFQLEPAKHDEFVSTKRATKQGEQTLD
jgi:hypothetical protein